MPRKPDDQITPAALKAAEDGHAGNLLAAMLPGGIQAQEAAGQRELTRKAERLPVEGTSKPEERKQWEAIGFVFGEPIKAQNGREVFVACAFPAGWSLKPTDHSMWSDVRDGKNRKRAALFFKAAFYDYHAHVALARRYTVVSEYSGAPDYQLIAYIVADADGEKAIHRVEVPSGTGYDGQVWYREQADRWLTEHFPDHASPLAYWD